MMDQTHIGYTYWQQPPRQVMPWIKYIPVDSINNESVDTSQAFSEENIQKSEEKYVFYELNRLRFHRNNTLYKAINAKNIQWKVIPDIGRDGDGITTFPVTANEQILKCK